ncbi:MAG TPA: 50S ribosomal protein L18 [Candidatus Nanoarchaeia archaeon]|nr:50S ribosomal protein L18 [Candidatus Nanoarchaeia archaeon]
MARKNRNYRRKEEGKTDYARRLELLKSGKTRLVIRKKLNNIIIQFIEYTPNGDKTIATFTKMNINKLGWKAHGGSRASAYLIGLLAGLKTKSKVKDCILDLGLQKSIRGSSIYAALKGVLDGGIKVAHSDTILPKEELIRGSNIKAYAEQLYQNKERYGRQFSKYLKNNLRPEEFEKHFDEIKNKILAI